VPCPLPRRNERVLVAARSLWLARASPVRDWLAIGQAVRAEPQRGGQVEHEGAVAEVLLTGADTSQ
jgi:hypothetical protein